MATVTTIITHRDLINNEPARFETQDDALAAKYADVLRLNRIAYTKTVVVENSPQVQRLPMSLPRLPA